MSDPGRDRHACDGPLGRDGHGAPGSGAHRDSAGAGHHAGPGGRVPGGDGHLARDEERLLACVHCGFCLSACPTYEVLGDENDSPRGRIQLMRALVEGRIGVEGAFGTHIGRCLGCRACEPVCPAGVEYGALLESTRSDAVERARGAASGAARAGGRLALWLLTGPARGAVFGLLRLLRAARLSRAAARLPGRPGLAAGLLEATRPAVAGLAGGAPAEPAGAAAGPDAETDPDAKSDPAAWTDTAAAPADDAADRPPTYALLEGCVMAGLFDHVHRATRRTAAAGGYREVEAPGQGCCGALHAHAGRLDAARRLARRNVAAFEASGAERIAVDSAGCGAAMREYRRWLADEPGWARRAGRLAERVRDVSELLADAPRPLEGRLEARIAYDAPCHLLHGQRVRKEPLAVLRAMRGAEVEPLASSDRCCGGAGVYNLLHPDISGRVLAGKLEEVRAGGYAWVATGNPGCIMQIGAGLRAAGAAARAVHPVELVDASTRGGATEQ